MGSRTSSMQEKWIDLTEPGAQYTIEKCLAYGWKPIYTGLTLMIMEMEI